MCVSVRVGSSVYVQLGGGGGVRTCVFAHVCLYACTSPVFCKTFCPCLCWTYCIVGLIGRRHNVGLSIYTVGLPQPSIQHLKDDCFACSLRSCCTGVACAPWGMVLRRVWSFDGLRVRWDAICRGGFREWQKRIALLGVFVELVRVAGAKGAG